MAEYREKRAIPMNNMLPTQEQHSPPHCIADVGSHIDDDDLFKTLIYIHGFGLGTLHLCLAIFVLFMFYKLWFTLKRRRPFTAVIHILILCFAIFRVISITAKGHLFDAKFGFLVQLIGDLGIPALTSAYALTVWVMFEIANVQISMKLQKKAFLAAIIVSHFIFIVVVDIVISLKKGTCILLLTCQVFNVLWGLILTVLFITATKRIYKIRCQQELFFKPSAFSKPVLDLTTENLVSVAMPCNRVGSKKLSSTGEEDSRNILSSPKLSTIPAAEAANVLPYMMNHSAPLAKDGSESTDADAGADAVLHLTLMNPQTVYYKPDCESQMDMNDREKDCQKVDFRKGDLRAHEKDSTTSNIIINVGIKTQVNHVELSTSDTTKRGKEKVENGSKINQFQVKGKGLSQSNGDVGGIKCDHDSNGKQGTSSGNDDIENTDNSPNKPPIVPKSSLPDIGKLTPGKPEEMLKIGNMCNISPNSHKLPPEMSFISRLFRDGTRTQSGKRNTDIMRQRFVSTRKKNPTKKIETVGILSAILGVAQVLLGFIGTSYIYNPQLVGTDGEPNPFVWLLFITILRILEFLFGLVLTFLAWQKSDSRMKNDEQHLKSFAQPVDDR